MAPPSRRMGAAPARVKPSQLLGRYRPAGQFLTVMPMPPELKELPAELKASDTRTYEPLGTVNGVPGAQPTVEGGRGRTDHRGGIAVSAAEEQELDAGGVRCGGV